MKKNILFTLLFISFIIMLASLLLRNINLLAIAEIIIVPTMFVLIRLNILNRP